jgi:signal peptide peptidase SppA
MMETELKQSAAGDLAAVPYLEQWTGPWAMRSLEFNALAQTIRKLDLNVHLSSSAVAAARDRAAVGPSYERDQNGVATIEIRGRMQKQQASLGKSTSTVALRQSIRAAAADDQVGAILLVIDSPGGTVSGTVELASDIAAAAKRKPVLALIEDVGASAAYWAASQATQVFTQPAAAVGSIGTYGVAIDSSAGARSDGYKVHVVRAGSLKGAGTPGTEITPEQLADFQREIDALNELFLADVAAGRKMPISEVRAVATGQVWIGQEAADLGLTDGVASADEASAVARVAAKTGKLPAPPQRRAKRPQDNRPTNGGAAATLAQQIIDACPGAPPAFICEQLAAGSTVGQAQRSFMASQQLALEQARKDGDAKVTESSNDAAAQATEQGVDPLCESSGGRDTRLHYEEFVAAVDAKVAMGLRRDKATSAVVRERPELQAAVIAEANATRVR